MTREPETEGGAAAPAGRGLPDHLDLLAEPLRTPRRERDDARPTWTPTDLGTSEDRSDVPGPRTGGGAPGEDVRAAAVTPTGSANRAGRTGDVLAPGGPASASSLEQRVADGRSTEHVPTDTVPGPPAATDAVPRHPAPTETVPTLLGPTETVPTLLGPTDTVPTHPAPTETVPTHPAPTDTLPDAPAGAASARAGTAPPEQTSSLQAPTAQASTAQAPTVQAPTERARAEQPPPQPAPTEQLPGGQVRDPDATRVLAPVGSTSPPAGIVAPATTAPVHHGGGTHAGARPGAWTPPPHVAPEAPSARHRRQPWPVIVLAMLFALTLGLATYLVVLTRAHEERAAQWEHVARTTGTELAQQRAELDGALAELDAVRTQLQTAQARITELADEKAQIGDEREAQRQLVDYQARVSEAAGKVAGALDVCVDGQYQLISYLENAAAYDAADLARFRTDVQQVCGAARDANAALQLELER